MSYSTEDLRNSVVLGILIGSLICGFLLRACSSEGCEQRCVQQGLLMFDDDVYRGCRCIDKSAPKRPNEFKSTKVQK